VIPDNIDDLIFLASQAFDNNEPAHFEILPAALIELNDKINSDNVDRFEPALQRALKMVMGDWRTAMGMLEHLLCTFFIDYIDLLIERFPKGAVRLLNLRNEYKNLEEKERVDKPDYRIHIFPLHRWFDESDSQIYKPFWLKLLGVLKQVENNTSLPLLSTPTHYPCWVEPGVLVDRVKIWQSELRKIEHVDFQIALSRVYLSGAESLVERVKAEVDGEARNLLCFLFDKNSEPVKPYNTIAHWWTAAITKCPEITYDEFNEFSYTSEVRSKYTGNYSWRVFNETYQTSRWDYKQRKSIKYDAQRKVLRIDLSPEVHNPPFFKRFFKRVSTPVASNDCMVYGELDFKTEWSSAMANDVKRFYSLVPNNPEKLLAKILNRTFCYSSFYEEEKKCMFIKMLEQYMLHPLSAGPMGHLFTAAGMVCSDKTARSLAGEIWIRGVYNDLIDSTDLGSCMGQFFNIEFSPLKRFTDLLDENMIRVSKKHDNQLQFLIENIMLGMSDKPIKGLKKLLEIYLEVIKRNNSKSSESLNIKFENWNSSKSLNKILNLLT
jgi:hypothetical protein